MWCQCVCSEFMLPNEANTLYTQNIRSGLLCKFLAAYECRSESEENYTVLKQKNSKKTLHQPNSTETITKSNIIQKSSISSNIAWHLNVVRKLQNNGNANVCLMHKIISLQQLEGIYFAQVDKHCIRTICYCERLGTAVQAMLTGTSNPH